MVKTSPLIIALVALTSQNVQAQSNIPTSELGNLDPSVLSSAIAHAQSTLSAMKTDPSFSSILANPTYSSLMDKASSAANGASSSGAASSGNAAGQSGGSSLTQAPIGVAALVLSAAVAVGLL